MAMPQTRLLMSCQTAGAGREGGAAGPETPHPGTRRWQPVASLPAGPLPSQLVTFPSRQASCWKPSGLPGPGASVPAAARGCPDSAAPFPPAFPPRRDHPGTPCASPTPTQVQAPLSPQLLPQRDSRPRVRVEVGAKSSLLASCWSILYLLPRFSSSLPLPLHATEVDSACRGKNSDLGLIPTSPNQLCDLENTT